MSEDFIVFKSLTYAYKAKDFLKDKFPDCEVVPTPRNLSRCGCSYSLKVHENFEEITSQLKQASLLQS